MSHIQAEHDNPYFGSLSISNFSKFSLLYLKTSSESSERFGSQTTILNFGLGSQTTDFIFWLGSSTTILNFGFGCQTKELNFWLGSWTILGLGLVVRLQYSTLGWVVGL